MGGVCAMWSSRHFVAIRALLAWQLECFSHCKTSLLLPQELKIRNENNGFQLDLELNSLVSISGFNC